MEVKSIDGITTINHKVWFNTFSKRKINSEINNKWSEYNNK